MIDQAERAAVLGVMESYFDGLYRADPTALRSIFHEDLGYVNATPGAYVARGLDDYLEDVANRSPTDLESVPNPPKVLQISQISESLVFVYATMILMGRDYRDALTLTKANGRWEIISKVFSYTELGEN